jgi:hypothetical protein
MSSYSRVGCSAIATAKKVNGFCDFVLDVNCEEGKTVNSWRFYTLPKPMFLCSNKWDFWPLHTHLGDGGKWCLDRLHYYTGVYII